MMVFVFASGVLDFSSSILLGFGNYDDSGDRIDDFVSSFVGNEVSVRAFILKDRLENLFKIL